MLLRSFICAAGLLLPACSASPARSGDAAVGGATAGGVSSARGGGGRSSATGGGASSVRGGASATGITGPSSTGSSGGKGPGNNGVYARPLAFVYATRGGKGLPDYSDDQLLKYFDQVKPGITSMEAIFLNVADASTKYSGIIKGLQQRNITLVPAVGGPPTNDPFTSPGNKATAQDYRKFTDYIRLESGAGYIAKNGLQSIQDMIDYLVNDLKYNHIMLNPWPEDGGKAVNYKNPQVEATFDNVLYPNGNQDWYPGNINRLKDVRAVRPSAAVLTNYESPGQQDALAKLSKDDAIKAMSVTVNQINGQFKQYDIRWCPPLGRSYDAFKLGTWDWIAQTLSKQN